MRNLRDLLHFWMSLNSPIGRRAYLQNGLGLAGVKYAEFRGQNFGDRPRTGFRSFGDSPTIESDFVVVEYFGSAASRLSLSLGDSPAIESDFVIVEYFGSAASRLSMD